MPHRDRRGDVPRHHLHAPARAQARRGELGVVEVVEEVGDRTPGARRRGEDRHRRPPPQPGARRDPSSSAAPSPPADGPRATTTSCRSTTGPGTGAGAMRSLPREVAAHAVTHSSSRATR